MRTVHDCTVYTQRGEGAMICTGRAVPPDMSYCTDCPDKELLSYELLAIPAAAVINVHKTPTSPKSRQEGRGRIFMYSDTSLIVNLFTPANTAKKRSITQCLCHLT